ncbi:MAG: hypothetical protein GXP32_03895 [Kiritimatiellaeota bacterium]|nr:hypothetical protein [Kiritimatiellota bacterium]
MKLLEKISPETKVFLIFFSILLIFTLGRGPIGAVNATLLTLSDEMPPPFQNNGDGYSTKMIGRSGMKRKKARGKKLPDKPTTTILPKTKTPVVAWCDTLSVSMAHSPKFPSLRKFDGTRWSKEDTIVQAVTDGNKIRFKFQLRDSKPDEAITSNSRGSAASAWMDDSIELFLMKDRKAGIYCQYVVSITGRGTVFLLKCGENNLAGGSRVSIPAGFILPLISARKTSDGFEIELTAALSNIDIDSLEPGDSFLIQIVRNYRGQRGKNSTILQLFPIHIYADNRHGANNHHRKAFRPVKIVDSKELK